MHEDDDRELWQVRMMLNQMGIDHRDLQRCPEPGPDTVFISGSRTVGVEVTRARPSGEAGFRQDGDRAATLQLADRMFRERSPIPVLVHAFWASSGRPKSHERKAYARAMADAVLAAVPEAPGSVCLAAGVGPVPLPAGLTWLKVVHLETGSSGWHAFEFADFANLGEQEIIAAVQRKSSKVETYLQHCDELWLLVVASADGPRSWASLQEPPYLPRLHPGITRVFAYSQVELRSVELVPRP